MRLNKYLAKATGMSRREADIAINDHQVLVNSQVARIGQDVAPDDIVKLDDKIVVLPKETTLLMLNKPIGYVSSRNPQAANAKTVYELLPAKYHRLKSIGRLDKDSSGLLLFTDDGDLSQRLTHPKFRKTKQYIVKLDQPLSPLHQQMISDFGIELVDGTSRLGLEKLNQQATELLVVMQEGRNRQIRRTFAALGYLVVGLHRISFGSYQLDDLESGQYKIISN